MSKAEGVPYNCTMNEIHCVRPMVRTEEATRCHSFSEQVYKQQLSRCKKNGVDSLVKILRLCHVTGLHLKKTEPL